MNRKQYRKLRTNQPTGTVLFLHDSNSWAYANHTGWHYVSPQEARELVDGGARIYI